MIRVLFGMVLVLLILLGGMKWAERRHMRFIEAEAEQASPRVPPVLQAPAAPAAPERPAGIGFGLSFAMATEEPVGSARLTCEGTPVPQDRPKDGRCNPYQGDTSCRIVLPVACIEASGGARAPHAALGATRPVAGMLIHSAAEGSQLCAAELGPAWRMAEFHDGGGWEMRGPRGAGLVEGTRYWMHINDQTANCWDSPR